MSVETIGQRGNAFIVRLDGDAAIGYARVYDAALRRLHPRRPLDEITDAAVRRFVATRTDRPVSQAATVRRGWNMPTREVTEREIESADRVDEAVPAAGDPQRA